MGFIRLRTGFNPQTHHQKNKERMYMKLRERAELLAGRPYLSVITNDKTTTGEDIFFAENPQLYGCMAQGYTEGEAVDSLRDARIDYIESLLEDREVIPSYILGEKGGKI